jgi:hypothetical protein
MLNADVPMVCQQEIQVTMKEINFQCDSAPHHGLRQLLKQLRLGTSWLPRKLKTKNLFPLPSFQIRPELHQNPVAGKVFYARTLTDPFYLSLLIHGNFCCTYHKPSPFYFTSLIKFSLVKP